jgi:hypothetical protein
VRLSDRDDRIDLDRDCERMNGPRKDMMGAIGCTKDGCKLNRRLAAVRESRGGIRGDAMLATSIFFLLLSSGERNCAVSHVDRH